MLKFLNKKESHLMGEEDEVREIRISITSVQGGAMIEITVDQGGNKSEENILLTPMDVALFIDSAWRKDCRAFDPVGHGKDGADIRAHKLICPCSDWRFVGGPDDAVIKAGDLGFVVPSFVINAMRIALKNMMESMMYPTTGDMEEEFG